MGRFMTPLRWLEYEVEALLPAFTELFQAIESISERTSKAFGEELAAISDADERERYQEFGEDVGFIASQATTMGLEVLVIRVQSYTERFLKYIWKSTQGFDPDDMLDETEANRGSVLDRIISGIGISEKDKRAIEGYRDLKECWNLANDIKHGNNSHVTSKNEIRYTDDTPSEKGKFVDFSRVRYMDYARAMVSVLKYVLTFTINPIP